MANLPACRQPGGMAGRRRQACELPERLPPASIAASAGRPTWERLPCTAHAPPDTLVR